MFPRLCVWFTDGNFDDDGLRNVRRQTNFLKQTCNLFIINLNKNTSIKNRMKIFATSRNFVFDLNEIDLFNTNASSFVKKQAEYFLKRVCLKNFLNNMRLIFSFND